MDNSRLNYTTPGIRLFIEDPQVALKRQIRRSVWTISIVIVITLAFILVLIFKIKENTQKLSQNQNLLSSSVAAQNISSITEDQLNEILPYKDSIMKALPEQTNLLDYQSALEQIAQNSGVQVSISIPHAVAKPPANIPGQTGAKKTTTSLTHTIEVKGPIGNINQFINSIENMEYFVQIDSLSINSTGGAEKGSSANLTLKVFTK